LASAEECAGVEAIATNALADIEKFQRFYADWVSFADDSLVTPPAADMQTWVGARSLEG
jgi:hypothetical protein